MSGSSNQRFVAPSDRPEQSFEDKARPLSKTEAAFEASRCLYCHDAPCIPSCPTAIDIPTFIRKIGTGNLKGAARTILSANLLGASCARVCPVEVLCESTCVYEEWERPPIPIGRLQSYALTHGASPGLLTPAPSTGHKVALVGGGPASLACAGTLALLGHSPVVFEKRDLPGGLNSTGVAPYKMRLEDALSEVEFVLGLGVEMKTGVEVGVQVSAEQLLADYAFVFIGPGLGPDSRLGVPGEQGTGVVGAVEWIEGLKTRSGGRSTASNAIVVGGGNTAIDAARELRGVGVDRVSMVYRRSRLEMSGYDHEWVGAQGDGVVLVDNAAIAEVVRADGQVVGVRLVETDAGRPSDRDLGTLPADLVVLAIGQAKLRKFVDMFPGVEVDAAGRIVAEPDSGRTGNPRVFAGGDARNGGKEVVNAVAEGQTAARAIDRLLRMAPAT